MWLSQLMLVPLMSLAAWGYLATRPAGAPARPALVFDVAVFATAIGLCWSAYQMVEVVEFARSSGIWRPVFGTLTTFFVFPSVLLAGAWLRRKMFTANR